MSRRASKPSSECCSCGQIDDISKFNYTPLMASQSASADNPSSPAKVLQALALDRLEAAIRNAVAASSPSTLKLIVGAQDSRDALAMAQRDLLPMPPARAAAIKRSQLAGVEMRKVLIERLQGIASRSEAAEILSINPSALDRRRERTRVLALPVGHSHVYPLDQFADGKVIPGIPEILAAMAGATPWRIVDFLTTPDQDQLTPFARLRADRGAGSLLMRRALAEMPTPHGG